MFQASSLGNAAHVSTWRYSTYITVISKYLVVSIIGYYKQPNIGGGKGLGIYKITHTTNKWKTYCHCCNGHFDPYWWSKAVRLVLKVLSWSSPWQLNLNIHCSLMALVIHTHYFSKLELDYGLKRFWDSRALSQAYTVYRWVGVGEGLGVPELAKLSIYTYTTYYLCDSFQGVSLMI